MKRFTVYIHPNALAELKRLPGHVRQRVKRIIDEFADDPNPSGSISLSEITVPKDNTIAHRLKLDKWRIVYAIDHSEQIVDVLAIRQRPPYDYGDIDELLERIT